MSERAITSGAAKALSSDCATGDKFMSEGPNVNAMRERLRDVLTPHVFKNADAASHRALTWAIECEASDFTAERMAQEAYRDSIVAELMPAVSSLLEEREREIREVVDSLLEALPDSGYYKWAWDECTGDEQEYVKGIRVKARGWLSGGE